MKCSRCETKIESICYCPACSNKLPSMMELSNDLLKWSGSTLSKSRYGNSLLKRDELIVIHKYVQDLRKQLGIKDGE